MLKVFHGWMERYFADEESVLVAVLLLVGFAVILSIGSILAPVFAAIVLAFLLQGLVGRLRRWRVPHLLAVIIATLLLVGTVVGTVFVLLPALWQQSLALAAEVPQMLTDGHALLLRLPEKYPALISAAHIDNLIASAGMQLGGFGQQVLSFSLTKLPVLFNVLLYAVVVPLLVFFLLKDSAVILGWAASLLPAQRPVMGQILAEMEQQVANYVRGKVIEIVVVFVCCLIAFALLGLDYALLLALLVGLSVVIPYIGAIVVTIPVAMIAFFQWGMGNEFMYLMIAYLVIQMLDGNLLVPLLFSEVVNLHPVAIIVAVLVFGGLWGFWGIFFAIPLATLVKAVLSAWPPGPAPAALPDDTAPR